MQTKISRSVFLLLLAALLLLPCLTACGGSDDVITTTASAEKEDGTVVTTTGGGGKIPDPKRDLGGYKFKAIVRSDKVANVEFFCEDFWVEQAGTDALSMTVYDRNAQIEEDFNCQMIQIDSAEDQAAEMLQFYESGEKYELGIIQTQFLPSLVARNLLRDLKKEKNLTLSADWYDQNAIGDLSILGKLFYITGDMNISTIDTAVVTLFNTELAERQKIDPFTMVENGTWTMDNMLNIAEQFTVNMQGEGVALDATKGDMVGYFEYDQSALYYYYGAGQRITTMSDGVPEFTVQSEQSANIVEHLFQRMALSQNPKIMKGLNAPRKENFHTGNVLFTDVRVLNIRHDFNTKDTPYGILPIPKYTEDQKEYYSVINFLNYVHMWTLPYACADADKASFLIDRIAEYSSKPDGTMEAYFLRTLELCVAKDGYSRQTLQRVRKSMVYDIALIYTLNEYSGRFGGFYNYLSGLGGATANTFSGKISNAAMDNANVDLERILDEIREAELPTD